MAAATSVAPHVVPGDRVKVAGVTFPVEHVADGVVYGAGYVTALAAVDVVFRAVRAPIGAPLR